MDYADYISQLSFRLFQPDVPRPDDRRLLVPRQASDDAKLIELPQTPIDVLNFVAPPGHESVYDTLGPLCRMPRMSTIAMGALISRAVAAMPAGHSYVNVGTWAGFSLMAALVNNRETSCIGIDNFSEFGGPHEVFYERFNRLANPDHHRFHEMDYLDYFANVHEGPIGVYLYDGEHSYENQLRGLQVAEPFFGEECIVIVDDTNWGEPYQATYDFVAASEREYTVLLDQRTAGNAHPTFWNGLLLLHSRARSPSGPPPKGHHEPGRPLAKHYDRISTEPAPLISLVLHQRAADAERLEAAIEEAFAQTWPALEILVADEAADGESRRVVEGHDRVAYVCANGGGTALAAAVEATQGGYVALADAGAPLRAEAVRIGVAFPGATEFYTPPGEPRLKRLENALRLFEEIADVVPQRGSFALANDNVARPKLDDGRMGSVFTKPEGDDEAVQQLDRVRSSGTDYLVLGWAAFDWLDRYPRLREELASGAKRVRESDTGIVFDLRA